MVGVGGGGGDIKILVDLESLMIYTGIQPLSFLGSERKRFLSAFYHKWAWPPTCSIIQNSLNKLSIPL